MTFESIRAWKKNTTMLKTAINEIAAETSHKCVECGHCTPVWKSMLEHFRIEHENKVARECTEADVLMQAPFGGELKK